MSSIVPIPPNDYRPDSLSLYFLVQSPPFDWIVRRGQGWIWLTAELEFVDGKARQLEVVIGKYPTYPGYLMQLRLSSDLLLELGLVNSQPPIVGRFAVFPKAVRSKI